MAGKIINIAKYRPCNKQAGPEAFSGTTPWEIKSLKGELHSMRGDNALSRRLLQSLVTYLDQCHSKVDETLAFAEACIAAANKESLEDMIRERDSLSAQLRSKKPLNIKIFRS